MTTEDPHDRTLNAAEEQPAGTSIDRAELLGATALTMRVRCPCGKRQDVNREDWQWDGVAVCPRCGRGILHESLHVVSRTQALAMIEERKPTESELRALRHVEMSLRHFILRHAEHPRWYWSPPTNALANEASRLLAELDESRRDRSAPPVVATGRNFLGEDNEAVSAEAEEDVAGEKEWAGDENDESLDEEAPLDEGEE